MRMLGLHYLTLIPWDDVEGPFNTRAGIYINLIKKIIETKKLCDNLLIFNDGKEGIEYFEALLQNLNEKNIQKKKKPI